MTLTVWVCTRANEHIQSQPDEVNEDVSQSTANESKLVA